MSLKYIIFLFIFNLSYSLLACDGIDVMIDVDNVSCYQGQDGRIEIVPTFIAQNLPYTYSVNGSVYSNQRLYDNLQSGNYMISVRDNTGCEENLPLTNITEQEPIKIEFGTKPIICDKDGQLFASVTGGKGPYLYMWNNDPSQLMDTLRNINGGDFTLQITDQNNCVETSSVSLDAEEPFSIEVIADAVDVTIGDEINLDVLINRAGSDFSYRWSPDNNMECFTCKETKIRLFETTQVAAVVHDLDNGCVSTDSLTIHVKGTFTLYIPNAFSPNEDGKNDVFLVYGVGILGATMNIYNKNGFLVFFGDVLNEGWDGTVSGNQQPEGVYFYHAEVQFTDGTISERKGQITLIR